MTEARYKIVFDGQLMPEMTLETVKDNLARLFKSDPSKIDALFSGSPVALKRDLAETEADKYLAALQQAGAQARKEQEAVALSLVDSAPEQASTSTPAAPTHGMTCPKCGHQQAHHDRKARRKRPYTRITRIQALKILREPREIKRTHPAGEVGRLHLRASFALLALL